MGDEHEPAAAVVMTGPVRVRVLGSVGIEGTGRELAPGLRRLLAVLTVHRRHVVSTDALVEHLWPEGPPGGEGTRALRTAISRLRAEIGADGVLTEPPGYRLGLADDQLDAGRFEAHLAGVDGRSPADALAEVDGALALWRGGAWQEYADEEWARGEAVRLGELRASATERRLELLEVLGRPGEAVAEAEAFVAAHPYRERARAVLLRSLAALGREADALRAFQNYRTALADAGLDPSAEMRDLEARVLAGEGRPVRPTSPARTGPEVHPTPARASAPTSAAVDRRAASSLSLGTTGFAFVGRDAERRAVLDAVAADVPAVLVSGEPGIGKTRLVQVAVERCVERGDLVLIGRCSEDLAAAYLPLSLAFAALDERAPHLAAAIGPRGADLAPLLLRRPTGGDGTTTMSDVDAETDRFRVLEVVRAWLTHLAGEGRVVLVLDDLHWVDSSTVAVLRDLLVRRPVAGLVVLGTYRRTEVAPRSPLAGLLADLERHDAIRRVDLEGLSARALDDLVVAAAGGEVGAGAQVVADLLHDRSQGNPLFAVQILRHLVECGAVAAVDGVWTLADPEAAGEVPYALRGVIEQRIGHLGPRAEALLDLAAVAGASFDLQVVGAVAGEPFTDAIELADAAVAAGVLREDAGRFGRYSFTHALVRDALVSRLSATRRATSSWLLAEALERRAGEAAPAHATELARLYRDGIPAGDPTVSARWSLRAGRDALEAAAAVEALGHADDALAALAGPGVDDRRLGVEALVLRTQVLRRGDDPDAVDRAAGEALDRAIELGEPDLIAEIAAGDVGPLANYDPARPPAAPTALAERALDVLPADAVRARLRVAAARAFWVHRAGDPRGPELADEVVELARSVGDPATLAIAIATVLHAHQRSSLADQLDARVAELEALVAETGLASPRGPATWGRTFRLARSGDLGGWARAVDDLERQATATGWATGVWTAALQRAAVRFATGELDGAVAAVDHLPSLARELGVAEGFATVYVTSARLAMAGELGHHEEVLDLAGPWVLGPSVGADEPLGRLHVPGGLAASHRAAASVALAELGRLDEARRHLDAVRPDGFSALRFMALHELNLANAAFAAALVGDRDAADELHRELEAYAGRTIWTLSHVQGPVDLALGRISLATDRPDRARRELDRAEATCRRSGMAGYLARTLVHRSEAHLALGDRAAARADADAGRAAADATGHRALAERSRALLADL